MASRSGTGRSRPLPLLQTPRPITLLRLVDNQVPLVLAVKVVFAPMTVGSPLIVNGCNRCITAACTALEQACGNLLFVPRPMDPGT